MEGASARARRRAGRGAETVANAIRRSRAGLSDPKRPIGSLHLPGTDGRGQDGNCARTRRVPLRRRAGHGPHRHERVHGEACRRAAHRRASGIRGLRRRRPAHRGRPPPALLRGPLRRDREGAPGRLQHAAAGAGRRPPDGFEGPHGGLQEHGADHDLEPGRASAAVQKTLEQTKRLRHGARAGDATCCGSTSGRSFSTAWTTS